jgi:cytochrome P450
VLIEAISDHPYTSEDARLSDIHIMAFAGHDTTAYTFCFFLMELGRHPEIRAKLQAEIATVMPREPLGHRVAAGAGEGAAGTLRHGDQKLLSAICGLEYLNQCIRESMRMWPTTANGSARHLHEDLHWEGMVLPKGSSIRAHNFSMFRESWIDRPLEFLPERWAADNPQLAELKEMQLNFSVGKRACIGQNMAMFKRSSRPTSCTTSTSRSWASLNLSTSTRSSRWTCS